MTFLETLQTHRGGLIRLKGQLYWYDGQGWDGAPGRVCLILDAAGSAPARAAAGASAVAVETGFATSQQLAAATASAGTGATATALLLIDGCPQWIWVAQEDVELIT